MKHKDEYRLKEIYLTISFFITIYKSDKAQIRIYSSNNYNYVLRYFTY